MQIIFYLSIFIFLTQQTTYAASALAIAIPMAPSPQINVQDFPQITITMAEGKKTLSCLLDKAVSTYICPNGANPILVKHSAFGFSGIGRDAKDNSPKEIKITTVTSKDKTIYEEKFFSQIPSEIYTPTDFGKDLSARIRPIANFFSTDITSDQGSVEYQKIANGLIQDGEKLKKDAEKITQGKTYQVELQDGSKLNCTRGKTKPLTAEDKENDSQSKTTTQCGVFSCDPVTLNGIKYQSTLIYDSNSFSTLSGSFHLYDNQGIGPNVVVRKVTSPQTPLALVDNSPYLDHPNEEASWAADTETQYQQLPQNLLKDKAEFTIFKDPTFRQYLNFSQRHCSDEEKTVSNFIKAKDKLLSKLAEQDLVLFIQLIGDDMLLGQYLDPNKARTQGCFYDGVYLDAAAAKRLDLVKKNLHPDKAVQTISLKKANELFKEATKMDDIAFRYKQDGCYARAHLMARRFEKEGIRVDKVWIKGDLYVPGANPPIDWAYHVAPIVYVEDAKGKIQKMVIDPSLFDRPVTVEEWDKKISKKTVKGSMVTGFPFPDNAAYYERSAIAFSSSDPYMPHDSLKLGEADKLKAASETMREYKTLE